MLGVLPNKFIKGVSTLRDEAEIHHFQNNCMDVMSLSDMLNTQFRTDAHFVTYRLTSFPIWPRLNKSILPEIREEGLDIVMGYFAFDWDNPEHSDWTAESLQAFGEKIIQCTDPVLSQWAAIYTTAHGARLIYKLSEDIPVDIGEYHLAWMLQHFEKMGFGGIDPACKDWTRGFRVPLCVREGKPTWEQSYYSCSIQEAVVEVKLMGKTSPAVIARKTNFIKHEHEDVPTFEKLFSLVQAKSKQSGRGVTTDFYKRAKKVLKDSEYLDILCNEAAPDWLAGHRNNEICRMLGHVTPVLIRECKASVEQIFALAVNPLLTLDNDGGQKDWIKHGWNALLDIYEREISIVNIENAEEAKKASKEIELLDGMVEGMKTWCDHPDLGEDDETARQFVKSNVLVSSTPYFYLMGPDGYYKPFAVSRDQVISRIRKTHLNTIIKTKRIDYTGQENDINVTSLQNDYSTPVAEIQMRPICDEGGFVENMNGEKPALILSTFCRNEALEPTYNPFVDEWLKNLFGAEYEKGCAWIGNALAFEEGIICALSLEGASSSGKKLLAVGLAECLKVPYIAGPTALYAQTGAFLRTPFLVIDEAWPRTNGAVSPADKFKSLIGGEGIVVNEKFKPEISVLCPVRMILTANDNGIVKELTKGKDMSVDNRIAVGERLFHVKVSAKARIFLRSIGGMGFTSQEGQRWIRPDSGSVKSDFVVAKHFMWLYHNRAKVDVSQRFLVMGNCAPGAGDGDMTVLETLLADNNSTPLVAQAILEMLDLPKTHWVKYLRTDNKCTRLWVTRYGVHKYVTDVMEERVMERDVFSGMQNLLVDTEPETYDQLHWYEVSIEALCMIATERGIAASYARTMLINKIRLQEAEMAGKA